MTAPLLSPLETPIFDEDVIAELEDHVDDVPVCSDCSATATWWWSKRCCGAGEFECDPCRDVMRRKAERMLHGKRDIICTVCCHTDAGPVTLDVIIREVRL